MSEWFGLRTAADDEHAFSIDFIEPLFPEDIFISDLTKAATGFHGNTGGIYATLERHIAGPAQEMDIVRLLQRVFPAEQIFTNPMRTDRPDLEFVDVMVVTERHLFLIQAKDSPNTEVMLRRKMERKRSTATSQLRKAVKQLGGAVRYARSQDPVTVKIGDTVHTIGLQGKTIVGLVVLKEMFDIDAACYAEPMLKLVKSARIPCMPMDYAQLHECTLNLRNEFAFADGLQAIFNAGRDNGVFPRLRFGLAEEANTG